MADEEAPGNGGGVHDVNGQEIQLECQHQRALHVADVTQAGEGDGGSGRVNSVGPKDLQNIRLVIDIGDDRTVEIPLKGKLILQNSGPPQAAAAAGDAAPGNAGQGQSAPDAEDKEFLMQMRGWLMTVGTLFVAMAFQAALQPPAWLQTADFLRLTQSDVDQWKHPFHGASHTAVAPARFAPSPSPSPQAAESATAGLSRRARTYMSCNYITFGNSLALVLMLMFPQTPHRAKRIMWVAKCFLVEISLCLVGTVVLGTSEDWRYMLLAVLQIGIVPIVGLVACAMALTVAFFILSLQIGTAIGNHIARFRALRAERTSAA